METPKLHKCEFCSKELSEDDVYICRCDGCFCIVCQYCVEQCPEDCPQDENCYMCPLCIETDNHTCANCNDHICKCTISGQYAMCFEDFIYKCIERSQ